MLYGISQILTTICILIEYTVYTWRVYYILYCLMVRGGWFIVVHIFCFSISISFISPLHHNTLYNGTCIQNDSICMQNVDFFVQMLILIFKFSFLMPYLTVTVDSLSKSLFFLLVSHAKPSQAKPQTKTRQDKVDCMHRIYISITTTQTRHQHQHQHHRER